MRTVGFSLVSRYNWWLSAVANSGYFCNVNNNGNANYNGASNAYGVRPISLLCSMCRRSAEAKRHERKRLARGYHHKQTEPMRSSKDVTATYGSLLSIIMGELFDRATSLNALYESFQKAKQGSDWKASVQRFESNLLPNLQKLQDELRTGTYKQQPFFVFKLNERGKTRLIKSQHIRDRVVQRSFCDNVLIPSLRPYLIYDNGASLKGKGISFTRKRLETHAHKFFRKHGTNGYILQVDFSKFFDNIRHDVLLERVSEKIDDPEALAFFAFLLEAFEVDVSDLSEEERKRLFEGVYNSLAFNESNEGEAFMPKGLGIGSQVSQISGVFALNRVDTLCKNVHACKFYGRYMDDIYIIHEDKNFLRNILEEIRAEALKVGLHINDRKTKITPLSAGFVYMQTRYHFTKTGKLIKRPTAKKTIRERRRLKAYRGMLDNGLMSKTQIANAYQSWRGNIEKLNSHRTVNSMNKLYSKLFMEN